MVSFPSKLPVWGSRQGSLLSLRPVFLSLLCSSFVVYGRLSPHLSPKSSAWNRTKEKRIFSSVSPLFSHLYTHRFHRCFGPARLSSPLHLHPSSHLFKHPVFALFRSCLFLSLAVELNLQPATPGVLADVRSLALKWALASSPDAFATLCHCDILAMWGDQDGVGRRAEAKWWVHWETNLKEDLMLYL